MYIYVFNHNKDYLIFIQVKLWYIPVQLKPYILC